MGKFERECSFFREICPTVYKHHVVIDFFDAGNIVSNKDGTTYILRKTGRLNGGLKWPDDHQDHRPDQDQNGYLIEPSIENMGSPIAVMLKVRHDLSAINMVDDQ